MPRTATTYRRSIETAERDAEMARYKVGRTYREVAEHYGLSVHAAYEGVQKAIADVRAKGGAEALADEIAKLDVMEHACWAVLRANHLVVSDGRVIQYDGRPLIDHRAVLQATQTLLKVSERRSKLLGLDAPSKQTITVVTEDVTEAAIRELEAQLAEQPAVAAG